MTRQENTPSFVIRQPLPEPFAQYLREAVETLRYYRLDAIDQLLTLYRDRWEGGCSSTMLRRGEFVPLLSDTGLADPLHAQKATFHRAYFNLRRQENDESEPHWSTICSRVRFTARAQWLCDQARELDGTIVDRQERWALPLPDCGQEWCPCRWDHEPD